MGKSVPIAASVNLLDNFSSEEQLTNFTFRESVGPLMWPATPIKIDIFDPVLAAARHFAFPKLISWYTALGIRGYVKGTSSIGVTSCGNSTSGLRFHVFASTDYASKAADRRSISGGMVMCWSDYVLAP